MCGIVGYIGSRDAQPILLDGLRRLEYRGYDSAGIAVLGWDGIGVCKCAGRIAALEKKAQAHPLPGSLGIGHTRWATHGEPSDQNAHPHTDVLGEIAIVHNGIIENYQALRAHLESKGCRFSSQTDTEAAAHLLHSLYRGDPLAALREAMHLLEGSYALAMICESHPEAIYCARAGSPLVIGLGRDEGFLASDIPALLPYTRDVLILEDRETAVITREGAAVYSALGQRRTARPYHVDWDAAAAEKGGYPHFMLKEIMEQPAAAAATLRAYRADAGLRPLLPDMPSGLELIGCGTAYHAALAGAAYASQLAGIPCRAQIASEYRYERLFPAPGVTALAISQSGETADTLAALAAAKAAGRATAALTNTMGSTLSRQAKTTLLTYAGPEIAVASTKAYITQTEALLLLAMDLGLRRQALSPARAEALLQALEALPGQMAQVLEGRQEIQQYCDAHLHAGLMLFIGRGMDYALAMEAALKLKEVSYLPCEAYAAGELKHGAIALVQQGTPVFALCTREALLEKTLANLRETKTRGAETVCICPERFRARAAQEADRLWTVPDAPEPLLPLLAILPLQLLSYYMALAQGRDVDKPRNLAKSVTVE